MARAATKPKKAADEEAGWPADDDIEEEIEEELDATAGSDDTGLEEDDDDEDADEDEGDDEPEAPVPSKGRLDPLQVATFKSIITGLRRARATALRGGLTVRQEAEFIDEMTKLISKVCDWAGDSGIDL